jgi:hypothetical protein
LTNQASSTAFQEMKLQSLAFMMGVIVLEPVTISGDPATNGAPTNSPAAAAVLTQPVSIDVEKVMPALALPDPWVAATPQQLKSMQLYLNSLLKGGMSMAGFTEGSRGFLHDKNAKVDVLTGEFIALSISQHGFTPQLFLYGFQKEKQDSTDSVNSNLNGMVSNFTWEKPTWKATLSAVVCPCSWQNFDGTTSRIRLYFIPTKTYMINMVVMGGTSRADQNFADVEQAISKISLPSDVVVPATWGDQMTALLNAQ